MPGAPSCPTPPPWCTRRGGSGSRLGTAAVTMNVCQATAADVRNLPTARGSHGKERARRWPTGNLWGRLEGHLA